MDQTLKKAADVVEVVLDKVQTPVVLVIQCIELQ